MESLVIANLKQRPLRTITSVLGISLGVVLVVLTVGLARGLQRDFAQRQSNVGAEIRFFPSGNLSLSSNPLMLPARYADAIVNGVNSSPDFPGIEPKPPIRGVAAVTPVGQMPQSSAGGIGFELIDGIDYPTFIKTTQIQIIEGRPLGQSGYEAIVDRYYAEKNRDADGNPVRIGSQIYVLGHRFTVVGIYEPAVLARVKIPLRTMQDLFGGANNCSFLMIKLEDHDAAEQVAETLKRHYSGQNIVLTRDLPALYSQAILPVEVFLDAVMGLALIISVLVILLAMYTTITERTREIGILKSLGASKGFIIAEIEKESLLISALGVAFGFIVSAAGKYYIESTTKLKIDLDLKWMAVAVLIGIFGSALGALYPAIRAAKLDPIEALSYE
jgi:putative ABC transport system permease protein